MRHVAGQVVLLGDRQRLHQVPAGEVRAADVAKLALAHQVRERIQRLLDRRGGVEAVQLEQVDVVRAEPLQGALYGADQMMARGTEVIRISAGAEGGLGREDDAVASPRNGAPEDLLGTAVR